MEKVAVPEGSLIARAGFDDYVDAYRVKVDPARVPDVDAAVRTFAKKTPSWISALMRTRDAVVGVFGLKRSVDAPPSVGENEPIVPGAFIGFFRVMERDEREIVAGEDDRHLDFRVSFLHERDGDDAFVVLTTVVRFHNALGRAYFVPVAPAHRRIVQAMLKQIVA